MSSFHFQTAANHQTSYVRFKFNVLSYTVNHKNWQRSVIHSAHKYTRFICVLYTGYKQLCSLPDNTPQQHVVYYTFTNHMDTKHASFHETHTESIEIYQYNFTLPMILSTLFYPTECCGRVSRRSWDCIAEHKSCPDWNFS